MNGNFEVNRYLARERVESRLREAEVHRQARAAQGDRNDRSLRRLLQPVAVLLRRLGGGLTGQLRSVRQAPAPRRQTR